MQRVENGSDGPPLGFSEVSQRVVICRRAVPPPTRSEEHTSELQSPQYLVCRLLLEKKHIPRHHQHLAARSHRLQSSPPLRRAGHRRFSLSPDLWLAEAAH